MFRAINILYKVILEVCFFGAGTNQLKWMPADVDILPPTLRSQFKYLKVVWDWDKCILGKINKIKLICRSFNCSSCRTNSFLLAHTGIYFKCKICRTTGINNSKLSLQYKFQFSRKKTRYKCLLLKCMPCFAPSAYEII